jgi:predicted nucleic acid-binding protein
METKQYLLDANALLDYLSGRLNDTSMSFMDEVVDAIPNVSVVTKIEVLSVNLHDEHMQLLHNFMSDAIILDLSPNVVKNCIVICKTHSIDLPRAIIAATAVTYNYTLITDTPELFANIKGLSIIDVRYI